MDMSKDVKDMAYWKEKYPFLNNMVTALEEFNTDVTSSDNSTIESLTSFLESWQWNVEHHKEILKKLTRNILLLNKEYKGMSNEDYCRFLNQWIYHTRKKHNINEYNVSVFYQAAHTRIVGPRARNSCPYYSYDEDYEYSINIIKLQNFYNNVNTIRDILIKESTTHDRNSQYCYAQRYANECVKIYRDMHYNYCSSKRTLSTKNPKTCSELKAFYDVYNQFLFINEDIKKKIPHLTSGEKEKHFLCQKIEPAPRPELTQGSKLALDGVSESGPEHGSAFNGVDQSDNPIPFNTTSVVSAMAGIPPFLALIYKFTPVGTMFRSKNKKSINVFNNLNEEIEKELFYSRLENANLNNRPERYNVAYGTV
ncbi:Plasmodium vivax Vir protein, putative [Plasmodium vivax]|uniref:Vir protein, putative n=1 Tax=Plasmodium vivax TaxID=5855 RepID=A0A1G4EAJ2_PLAVI|nr:Plasmodium vivax Vir protein, putative [Plasmodium vivax]